ncbi:Ig-like domain-containing protein [Pseudomonas sp. MDT2-39-1]
MTEDESKMNGTEHREVEEHSGGELSVSADIEIPDSAGTISPLSIREVSPWMIVDPNQTFQFHLDAEGSHQVWIKVSIAGSREWIHEGEFQVGFRWNIRRITYSTNKFGFTELWHYWQYYNQNSSWLVIPLVLSRLPVIDALSVFTNTIKGSGGDATELAVWVSNGSQLSGRVTGGTRWSIPLWSEVHPGTFPITVEQSCAGYSTRWSEIKTITYFAPPKVTTPVDNTAFKLDSNISVSGTWGAPGEQIQVLTENGLKLLGQTHASGSGSWGPITFYGREHYPLGGWVVLQVGHKRGSREGWKAVRVFLAPPPTLNADPDPQDQTFNVSGLGGAPGLEMQILKDLGDNTPVGKATLQTDGAWTVSVTVPAGRISLVAELVLDSFRSGRSVPQAFNVRPPALTTVTVTYPTETTVKFSGSGHTGATVDIKIVSGPGGTVPPSVQVKPNGVWDTTATNWTTGLYTLTAIQKVSDNANDWIESQPYPFTVDRQLEDPTNVQYTKDYQPTFSGNGNTDATVRIANPGYITTAAPDTIVVNGQWSSKASEVWGPTFNRDVHIKQFLNGQQSPTWVPLYVCIPPLAPDISKVDVVGLLVAVSGTCWQNAEVELTFSDRDRTFAAEVTGTDWVFQRAEHFEPDILHTVTVTQTAAEQTSLPASETFQTVLPIPQPVITDPAPNAEVGRDMTVQGNNGLEGATMQLRDTRFGAALGEPKLLTENGEWSIDLTELQSRQYIIDAQQTLNGRESLRSDPRTFQVVLLPPVITVPTENENLPRTSILEGRAMPGGRVEVWQQGATEPLLTNIAVGNDGSWKAEVTLPVGVTTIWARQTFEGQTSKDSQPSTYNVVPAKPSIETPAADEHVGRWVVVSGFGVPGDTVAVKLINPGRTVLRQSPVLEDRTWSVTVEFDQPGGRYSLVAVASCDGFESADSLERPVVLGTYLPVIESPEAGRWVSHPVEFKGQGREGGGEVVSWFNPELKWAVNIRVFRDWQGVASQLLPLGGQWCRFKQTLTDSEEGATVSDWAESKRFEVVPAPSTEPGYPTPDERS